MIGWVGMVKEIWGGCCSSVGAMAIGEDTKFHIGEPLPRLSSRLRTRHKELSTLSDPSLRHPTSPLKRAQANSSNGKA